MNRIDRTKLVTPLVFLMFFIFLVNLVALKLYWYYSIWYFDMPMHFLGGLWVGLFFLWFFSIESMPFLHLVLERVDFKLVSKTLLFVLLFGVLWELFEFYTNNYIGHDLFNILDTTSDIFFDLSGGLYAILYVWKNQKTKQQTPQPK